MEKTEMVLNSSLKSKRKFKIVLVGDGGTGKSSYIDRFNNGSFRKEYIATMGMEKHDISFSTSYGEYILQLCDTAGQEKLGALRDSYYENIDAAIIFFDVNSRVTYKNVPNWHRDIERVCSEIPIALCANKIDCSLRKVKSKHLKYHEKFNMKCFEISVKDKLNLKEPMQYLLQKLINKPNLLLNGALGTCLFDNLGEMTLSRDSTEVS